MRAYLSTHTVPPGTSRNPSLGVWAHSHLSSVDLCLAFAAHTHTRTSWERKHAARRTLCTLRLPTMDRDQDGSNTTSPELHESAVSPSTSSSSMQPSASTVAEAFEKRLRQQREEQQAKAASGYVPFDADHEKRQELRRMIDPGILRPNARRVALESLRVLRPHRHLCFALTKLITRT